jgi:hypothetical protein
MSTPEKIKKGEFIDKRKLIKVFFISLILTTSAAIALAGLFLKGNNLENLLYYARVPMSDGSTQAVNNCIDFCLPVSLSISLKMFSNDGGKGMPLFTEKHSPLACPAPWYGSWPRITTLTLSKGQWSKALNMSLAGGYMGVSPLYSSRTKVVSRVK